MPNGRSFLAYFSVTYKEDEEMIPVTVVNTQQNGLNVWLHIESKVEARLTDRWTRSGNLLGALTVVQKRGGS